MVFSKNWSALVKPSNVVYDDRDCEENTINFIVEPLEIGFGLTVGNALRRILLSSIRGSAITGIRIYGVDHEFSAQSGVKEDMVDIILNLKKTSIQMHDAEFKKINIKVKGPCAITAAEIQKNSDIEVMNPDQLICTVSEKIDFEMDLYCTTGKGYLPANLNKQEMPEGVIAVDALYNPVRRVHYDIRDARVGQVMDYDKLVMSVQTDGSITPETAIGTAAKILQDQLQFFVNFEYAEEPEVEKEEELGYNTALLKKVDDLELSVRSRNCLQNENIVYIGDLVAKTESEMLKTQNFGRKSLNEIKAILEQFGLKFGMDVPAWPPENVEVLAKKYEDNF